MTQSPDTSLVASPQPFAVPIGDALITPTGGAQGRLADKLGGGAGTNTQSGTTYTLQSSDNGKVVNFTSGSSVAVTVPSGLGATFQCLITQSGAGQLTFTGSGATVNNRQSFTKTAGQYAVVSLLATAANTLLLAGDGA